MSKYNPKIVIAYFISCGIPIPELEYRFCSDRKWRFDFAWPVLATVSKEPGSNLDSVALEVQGGIFIQGRHSRGAALLKEWEKLNAAAILGWRILYCQPADIYKKETMDMIKRALGI